MARARELKAMSSVGRIQIDEPAMSWRILHHAGPTMGGYSGGPCINSEGDLIALHIGGGSEGHLNYAMRTSVVVRDASSITRALPLKQLRLITPDAGRVSGTDAVTLVFSQAVIALARRAWCR